MNSQDPSTQKTAPEIYLRSYEDKDELYMEDYCRGLGDPDYFGYPGEPKEVSDGRPAVVNPKPF